MELKNIKRSGLAALIMIFSGFCLNAQNPTYNQLVSIISSKLPGVDISNKIISFTSWSAANQASRDINKEFDRVCFIYEGAKLRNGNRGTVMISCNMDDAASATILANRDGITYAIRINKTQFDFLSSVPVNSNVVYDNTGAKVYENLKEDKVFISYNQLLTR